MSHLGELSSQLQVVHDDPATDRKATLNTVYRNKLSDRPHGDDPGRTTRPRRKTAHACTQPQESPFQTQVHHRGEAMTGHWPTLAVAYLAVGIVIAVLCYAVIAPSVRVASDTTGRFRTWLATALLLTAVTAIWPLFLLGIGVGQLIKERAQ
jgi:hypothetical protein